MINRLSIVWPILAVWLTVGVVRAQDPVPPRSVKVLPIFFVPKGQPGPTDEQAKKLLRHLDWSQSRYRDLLGNQCTFAIAEGKPHVYQAERELAFYRAEPEGGAPQMVGEMLRDLNINRYNCPYVLLLLVMNPKDDFPVGGGRPLNGGVNTGGGVIQLSSFALDRIPNFQSTLQHELGHAFGLPHVDAYGYDMASNDSIMAYNRKHHTKEFTPSETPGKLIAEDLRALALNQRVFPKLRFDPTKDMPSGYSLAGRIVPLGPMKIPGLPDGIKVTTDSGEEFNSKVSNIVQGQILPSKKIGAVTYDAKAMWHSAKSTTGWVSVKITFPYEVELTRLAVHSQHSGDYHAAQAVRVSVQDSERRFQAVAKAGLKSIDEMVNLPKTKGRVWQFEFQAGESGFVVLRGLQFFFGDDELFPPLVPYQP